MVDEKAYKFSVALDVRESDKFVFLKEHGSANNNFVMTHLMEQMLKTDRNRVCLVLLQNCESHFQHVGKKFGYDLTSKIDEGKVVAFRPMISIYSEHSDEELYHQNAFGPKIIAALWDKIEANITSLMREGDEMVYVIIDDLSHLIDIGVDFDNVIRFIIRLQANSALRGFKIIVNMHISDDLDSKVSSVVEHFSDVHHDVTKLKTEPNQDVSGVIKVNIGEDAWSFFHYKITDEGILTILQGESLDCLIK